MTSVEKGARHRQISEKPEQLPPLVVRALMMSAKSDVERCGFLTNKYDIVWVRNAHESPDSNFIMDQNDYKKAIERIAVGGDWIIAVFHTHPSGNPFPSANDISGWPDSRLAWWYLIATPYVLNEYQYVNEGFGYDHASGLFVRKP